MTTSRRLIAALAIAVSSLAALGACTPPPIVTPCAFECGPDFGPDPGTPEDCNSTAPSTACTAPAGEVVK